MRLSMVAMTLVILLSSSSHVMAATGKTPSTAKDLKEGEVTGSVKTAVYYSFTAGRDGILEVTAVPVKQEIDLSVTHFTGSPASESRRVGMAEEEISMKVRKGDRFLIRVNSPMGVAASFKMKVLVSSPQGRPVPDVFVPRTTRDGSSPEDAVEIPLGKIIPVEARGTRYFRMRVPAGFVLAVALHAAQGEFVLEGTIKEGDQKYEASSRPVGALPQYVYLPTWKSGEILIRIAPPESADRRRSEDAWGRYALITRLRHVGLAPAESMEPNDRMVLEELFRQEGFMMSVPPSKSMRGSGAPDAMKFLRLL